MKIKRMISACTACLMLFATFVFPVSANSNEATPSYIFDDQEGEAKVVFVDPELAQTAVSRGVPEEVYDHSYYKYSHKTISDHDVGPRLDDKFLVSVARGETKNLEQNITVHGSISYTNSVDAEIKKLINVGLELTTSGGFSYTWTKGSTYSVPIDAEYNSYSFYGAVNFDTCSCYLERYDVYKLYNGSAYIKDITYYKGYEIVNEVNVPKKVSYSVGSMQ